MSSTTWAARDASDRLLVQSMTGPPGDPTAYRGGAAVQKRLRAIWRWAQVKRGAGRRPDHRPPAVEAQRSQAMPALGLALIKRVQDLDAEPRGYRFAAPGGGKKLLTPTGEFYKGFHDEADAIFSLLAMAQPAVAATNIGRMQTYNCCINKQFMSARIRFRLLSGFNNGNPKDCTRRSKTSARWCRT